VKAWLPVVLVALLSSCGRTGGVLPAEHIFVIIGDSGGAYVSEDGSAWEKATAPTTENLIHLARGAGRFVAVGAKGTILSSTDGRAWSRHDSGTTVDLSGVAFAGERFVAVGGDWSVGAVALTSADGTSWTPLSAPSNQMFTAAVARGSEVLVSAQLRSDLLTPSLYVLRNGAWDVQQGPAFAHGFTDSGGTTYVVGNGSGARTTDGTRWEMLGIDRAHAITTSGAGFVAVGEYATVFTSADGASWTSGHIQSGAYFISGITYGRETYVALAEPGFAILSPEGAAANNRMVSVGGQGLNDIAFGP
jgi:large repetitive protein